MAVATVFLLSAHAARAASVYYRMPVNELKLTDGKLPDPTDVSLPHAGRGLDIDWERFTRMRPWVAAAGGEAYLQYADGQPWAPYARGRPLDNVAVVVRAEAGKDVAGQLVVPAGDWSSMVALKFTIPAAAAADGARAAFYQAKVAHYDELLARQSPGSAWFRYQARQARQALGQAAADPQQANQFNSNPAFRTDNLDDTYGLFSGGRALSENLQLDRALPADQRAATPTVSIDSIKGVTVKEMDWAPLVKDKHPQADPLAAFVPVDQHAVFFPTFAAMMAVVDEADEQGVPALQAFEPRAEDARTKERYQKQLCLSLTGLGRLLGPRLIDSMAVTGSDPYLRVGSDVAILFEAKDVGRLKSMLSAQVGLWRQEEPSAKAVEGKAAGLEYFGARSPDRSVCAYIAQVGDSNVIAVTNSLAQLERLSAVRDGKGKSIASAPEYTFFRDRYKRGEDNESAFVVLTDATIRRWCGPKWRIADARRTQAAAVMADLQAKYADDIARAKVEPVALKADRPVVDFGDVRLTPAGVESSTYGSLDYMTPIVELDVEKVTVEEARFYERWRDGYQQNWTNYFDPIAVRLSVGNAKDGTKDGKSLAADLTVLPLIAGTQYAEWIEVTRGVKLLPGAGDPHAGALFQLALAVDRNSKPVRQLTDFAKQIAPQAKVDPFGWVGKSVSVYVDADPFWEEAAKAEDPEKFLEEHWERLPVAAYVASDSPFKLAAFMTAVHAYVDQSAPNITRWETVDYNGQSYVRVSSKGSGAGEIDKARLYYATTPEALVLTLNEDVIKRALDRQSARQAAKEKGADKAADKADAAAAGPAARPATQPAAEPLPWLGDSVAVAFDARAMGAVRGIFGTTYRRQMQQLAWNNLPALNEWKRLYPDQDPVAVHERLWQVRLVDPAGGRYVWNEEFQTMESTTYGHPAAPKPGPGLPPQLDGITRAAMGVTFEQPGGTPGLRARAVLEHKGP